MYDKRHFSLKKTLRYDQYNEEKIRFFDLMKEINYKDNLSYVGRLLQRASKKFSLVTALICQDEHITYKDLYEWSCNYATFLRNKGVKQGDNIIIYIDNSIEFYIAYFAVWSIGCVVVPLNTFLERGEVASIVGDAKPSCIIAEEESFSLFNELVDTNFLLTGKEYITNSRQDNVSNFLHEDRGVNDLSVLLYTSGTTGNPKGVMLSSHNILTNIAQTGARFRYTSRESVLGVLPLFHVFAQNSCIWSAFFIGATVIIVPKIERHTLIDALKHKPTIFIGVPALYGLLCQLKKAPLDSIKYFICGGDALPDKLRAAFGILYGRKIINGFGLTETSPVIAVDLDDTITYTNTVGMPMCEIECSIRDSSNQEIEDCYVIGQLWVKGDNVMLGYYNDTELTNSVIVDGFFDTGDCAYFDYDGKLVITGREKDLIIHKGMNIYPQEVENIIISYPNVIRVAVIGQEDKEGETPIAFVQMRKIEPGIEKKLKNYCKQHIAQYKVPRSFTVVDKDLPMTTTGKIDKKNLRNCIKNY